MDTGAIYRTIAYYAYANHLDPADEAAVLAALDGSTPVLAAVKPKDTDFLRRVRQHPHGEVFNITPESREALYQHLRSRILQWNKEEL